MAGAPSPVAFRRWAKRELLGRLGGGVDLAWRIDWEVDRLLPARLLHLVWALAVQVQAAEEQGLAAQVRGWAGGLALASALGLVGYDAVGLGLSGADGLTAHASRRGSRINLAVPPSQVGDLAAWFLEWGRRRRRRFIVALVAPSGRLLPFDWEPVRELAVGSAVVARGLSLAWVPGERVVQIPWGETGEGFPVALLPPPHLRSSGVHLVTLEADPLFGAAVRRRPKERSKRTALMRRVLKADDAQVYKRLAKGWIPPVLAEERPVLAGLLRDERPGSFDELVTLVAMAEDDLRRDYFLERFQGRRGMTRPAEGLPVSSEPLLASTRGLLMFREQIGALIAHYAGWDAQRAYQFASDLAGGEAGRYMLDAVIDRTVERGLAGTEARALELAIERWASLTLSRRAAAARASLIFELALTSV